MSLAAAAVALVLAAGPPDVPDVTRTVSVGSAQRSYLVHLPAAFDAKREYPVVLAFHGGATNPGVMARFSGLSEKADQAGFVVVYPSGSGRLERVLTWNAGRCCGYASEHAVDDVGFVRALLEDLAHVARIDRHRVFATGISNGGQMAYRVAAELPDVVAAIAPVSGSLEVEVPRVSRPVSVVHFHGTDDEYLPFEGGRGPRSLVTGSHASVARSIGTWVKLDRCRPAALLAQLAPTVADGTTVVRHSYVGCRDGAEVMLYEIRGGGHTWPGRPSPERLLGKATQNVSANDVMWEFFTRHPMR
jgi:polyhydroxybutyrate depolymerase